MNLIYAFRERSSRQCLSAEAPLAGGAKSKKCLVLKPVLQESENLSNALVQSHFGWRLKREANFKVFPPLLRGGVTRMHDGEVYLIKKNQNKKELKCKN